VTAFRAVGDSVTSSPVFTSRKELALEPYVGSNGYVQNAGFQMHPIAALELGAITGPVAIVMHRTVSTSAESALSAFTRGIGTHFVIDKDGTTYQCADLRRRTAHVGPIRSRCFIEDTCPLVETTTFTGWTSRMKCHDHEKVKRYPDRYPMNEDSVGIEVVAMYDATLGKWDAANPPQSLSIHFLVDFLKDEYGLSYADIYQHDEIAWKTAGEGADLYYVPNVPIVQPRFPPA